MVAIRCGAVHGIRPFEKWLVFWGILEHDRVEL